MAERGVIVEFDFTALDGADLLFNTTKKFLNDLDGIGFDAAAEAAYLTGSFYLTGLTKYFQVVKTKKTAQKAARDLAAAFVKDLNAAIPAAITPGFRNFVKALADKGVKVVIATRADLDVVRSAFEPVLGEKVSLYHEETCCYGASRWDSWRRVCAENRLRHTSVVAVAGSGVSVKAALWAGLASFAVIHDHVAYQDFGGADEIVKELSGTTAKKLLEILHL